MEHDHSKMDHSGHDMSKMSHQDHEAAMTNPQMAKAMEIQSNRKKLAEMIRPHLKDAHLVGVPAIIFGAASATT